MLKGLDSGYSGKHLPQRSCVRQPRVTAWSLPWVIIINQIINPKGVTSGVECRYAAIVIIRPHSFGVFNKRPQAIYAECGATQGNARLFGWDLEKIGLSSGYRGRHGRSCAPFMSIGSYHFTGRLGEGNQTGVQHLDQTAGTRINRIRVAGRIWRVFSQRIRHGQNTRIHIQTTGAPQQTNISRRISGVSHQTWHGMGRTICLGMTQSRWDCMGCDASIVPRVDASRQPWAIGQNPVGIRNFAGSGLDFKRQRRFIFQPGVAPHGATLGFHPNVIEPHRGSGIHVAQRSRIDCRNPVGIQNLSNAEMKKKSIQGDWP